MPQPIPYQTTHVWRSDREKKTLKNTYWRLIDCKYVLQWMPCAMHDYKYELDEEALWWGWWLWRWKWRLLGFVDEDDDDNVLASVDAHLLTCLWGPLYKSCSSGQSASVSMPYGRFRPYGMSSFVLSLQTRLLLFPSFFISLPFHFHAWFLPFLAHFVWKDIKERICGILCIH